MTDTLVSQPQPGVTYVARRENLRLVKMPSYPVYGPGGVKQTDAPGETIAFSAGQLFVPNSGKVRLENGREIDAGELRAWLESHRAFDDREEGFFRMEVAAPAVSEAETAALMEASLDLEQLTTLIAQEEAGWARPEILTPARAQLAKLNAFVDGTQEPPKRGGRAKQQTQE